MSVNIKTANGLKRFAGNTISTNATPLMSGLMSAEDKQKLDSVGDVGVDIKNIAFGQNLYIPYETLSKYDFIYMEVGGDYTNEGKAVYGLGHFIVPFSFVEDFLDSESCDTVMASKDTDGYAFGFSLEENEQIDYNFWYSRSNGYASVYGIKIKGQTASGGKTLIIDSDSAEAETYTIVGSEDATLLNLEMYGEVGSTKGTGMYLIYSNGTRGTSSTITALGTTLITYSMSSAGTLTIGKKANVKLKVWAEGVGYTVNKQ